MLHDEPPRTVAVTCVFGSRLKTDVGRRPPPFSCKRVPAMVEEVSREGVVHN
jgi:hypothetical protein